MKKINGRAALVALVLIGATPAFSATALPLNTPTPAGSAEVVCTGVGADTQHDARWAAYPLKIVIAGKGGQFVADSDIIISQESKEILAVHCGGPWLLVKLSAGRYRIAAVLEGQSTSGEAVVPATGQSQVILRFPGTGGAISPEHKEKLQGQKPQ